MSSARSVIAALITIRLSDSCPNSSSISPFTYVSVFTNADTNTNRDGHLDGRDEAQCNRCLSIPRVLLGPGLGGMGDTYGSPKTVCISTSIVSCQLLRLLLLSMMIERTNNPKSISFLRKSDRSETN
jgi:hypothetical protein